MGASSIRRAESVLKITVQRDGTGDFTTISEAVLAVPYECEAEIEIGPGIYREKLVCEKRCITLRGTGADKTKLVWGDGGKLPHKDGRPTHTFRSYTAFFSGERLRVEDHFPGRGGQRHHRQSGSGPDAVSGGPGPG